METVTSAPIMDPPVQFYLEYEDFPHRFSDREYRDNLVRLYNMCHLYPHLEFDDVYPTLYLTRNKDAPPNVTKDGTYDLSFSEIEDCVNSAIMNIGLKPDIAFNFDSILRHWRDLT